MGLQARIPAALAAIHNFIRLHDPGEVEDFADASDPLIGERGALAVGDVGQAERTRADTRRDGIADAMWEQYMQETARRAAR